MQCFEFLTFTQLNAKEWFIYSSNGISLPSVLVSAIEMTEKHSHWESFLLGYTLRLSSTFEGGDRQSRWQQLAQYCMEFMNQFVKTGILLLAFFFSRIQFLFYDYRSKRYSAFCIECIHRLHITFYHFNGVIHLQWIYINVHILSDNRRYYYYLYLFECECA